MSYMIQSSSPTPPSDFMLPPPATAVVSGRNGVVPEVGSRVRISARRGGRNGVIVKTEIKDGVKKFDVKLDHDFKEKFTRDLGENDFEILGVIRRVLHTWEHKPATTGEYIRSTSIYGAGAFIFSPITNLYRSTSTAIKTKRQEWFGTPLEPTTTARISCKVHGSGQLVVMQDRYLDEYLAAPPLPANSMEDVDNIDLQCGRRYKFAYLLVNGGDNCATPNLFECTVTDPRDQSVKYVILNLKI